MILEKITLTGFLSFIEEEIDLRNSHITLISGLNGEGKSACLESVPFCFWGVGRGKTLSDYINDSCDTLRVEVIFVMESVRYRKVRQYGEAGNINELYLDKINAKFLEDASWKLLSDDTKRKTDELLTSIVGFNDDLFFNSVFFGQKDTSTFISGATAERKELLCNLLGINLYEQAEEAARKLAAAINNTIQVKSVVLNDKMILVEKKSQANSQHESAKRQLTTSASTIADLQGKIDVCQTKREKIKINAASQAKNKETLQTLTTRVEGIKKIEGEIAADLKSTTEDLESTIDEGIEQVETLQNIIDVEEKVLEEKKQLEAQLQENELKKAKLPELKAKLESHRQSKERFLGEQREIATQLKNLAAKRKKINTSGAVCPITEKSCDKLSESSKQDMIKDIDHEQKSHESQLDIVEKELKTSSENVLDLDQKIEAISKVNDKIIKLTKAISILEQDLKKIETAKSDLPKTKKKYRTVVDKLTTTKETLEKRQKETANDRKKLLQEVEELKKQLTTDFDVEIQKINNSIKAYNDDLKLLNVEREQTTKRIGQLESEIQQIKNAEEDVKKIKDDLEKLTEDLRVHTELGISFGPNGIQKEIISNNVPILEEKTNEFLSRFTRNGQFKVKFDLDPVTKSGKLKKTGGLDIIIYQQGQKPRALNMYSGGETVRIVFAILLSLSYLLTKRAGKRSQTLIIDERVAALDNEGINQFIEIVKYISDQYKKIFIVSHISELKEAFPNEIAVSKDEVEGSHVAYHLG